MLRMGVEQLFLRRRRLGRVRGVRTTRARGMEGFGRTFCDGLNVNGRELNLYIQEKREGRGLQYAHICVIFIICADVIRVSNAKVSRRVSRFRGEEWKEVL